MYLEMNAGTCWGKNTIGPRGRSVEKAPGSDFYVIDIHNIKLSAIYAQISTKSKFSPSIKTKCF
jgi:hypothetical protein